MAKPVKSSVFLGCGSKPGVEIWRIENFEAQSLPQEEYGKFATGDSYLVLSTKGTVQRNGQGSFQYDIFFWLGEESSQDEKGTAALKAVELDDHLGGSPIQHRETQGHESQAFLALFPEGIQYTAGGVDSGFKKVSDMKFQNRLLHLKGRRHIRVEPCAVAASSLNSGDVFLLDIGTDIFQWNGKDSSRTEKAKGLEMTKHIRDNERGAKAKAHVVDEGTEPVEFWAALGVSEAQGRAQIKSAEEGGSDVEAEKEIQTQHKLYRVSDASGKLEVVHVASPPLKYSHLDFNDAFILDIGSMIFVWIGKMATKQEKEQSMANAQAFLQQMNRPAWVPVTRIVQGSETPLFKAQFVSWPLARDSADRQDRVDFTNSPRSGFGKGVAKTREQQEIDVEALIKSRPVSSTANLQNKLDAVIDDGHGVLEVYRIEKFNKVLVPKEQHGIFFSGDSYLVIYTPDQRRGGAPIIYFWLGRNSTSDEKGAAAWLTKFAVEKVKGFATQVRITQGHEPNHFLSLFRGKFVVKFGGIESGFHNATKEEQESANSKTELFHVKGSDDRNVRAVQVLCKTESLNSSDAFVLNTAAEQFIWLGAGCNDAEKRYARNIAAVVRPADLPASVISEGAEPEEFWAAFGGKGEYVSSPELQDEATVREPRLFWGSDASGTFKLEEIMDFSQDDLMMDEVYILDAYQAVFVWIGPDSTKREKEMAFSVAQNYVKKAAGIDGRSPDTPVVQVNAGFEPPIFTCWFLGWDATRKGEDAYQRKLAELGKPKQVKPTPEEEKAQEHQEALSREEARYMKFVQLKSGKSTGHASTTSHVTTPAVVAPAPEPTPAPTPVAAAPVSPRASTSFSAPPVSPRPLERTSSSTEAPTTPRSTTSASSMTPRTPSSGAYYRGTSMYNRPTVTSSPLLSTSATGYTTVAAVTAAPAAAATVSSTGKTYPYDVLKRVPGANPLPDDVDASRIEAYLSDAEFKAVMGCTKEQFSAMKAWQQKQKKQAAKIF